MGPSTRNRLAFGAVFAAGLAWRIAYVYVWGRSQLVFSDGKFFHLQGVALADGRGYVQPIDYFYGLGAHASAAHPPLFSTVLGVATRAVRVVGFTGNSARFHEVVCALLSGAAVLPIAAAARRLAGNRAGFIAAAIAAALPALWVSDAVVMSESLVTLVVAVFVAQVLRCRDRPSVANILLLAVAAGAAALTRAELVLLFPVIVVPFALRSSSDESNAVRRVVLAAVCFAAVLAPWTIRNAETFSRPVFLSTNVGSMVAGANCPPAYAGPALGGWTVFCQQDLPPGDESVGARAALSRGLHYAQHHADRLPIVVAARLGRTFEMFRPFDDSADGTRRLRWVAVANTFTFFPLQLAAGIGIWRLRRRRIAVWPFLAILGIVIVTTVTGYGVARFRVPWDVAATVLAAASLLAPLPSGTCSLLQVQEQPRRYR